MNVRFFAGTKAEYLSLPTPRNPLGLYFCEDTKELFWADRLLTDGIRVVPTFADLPKRAEVAADGVVYYVTETRNGYVLSPDRSEWLQTIYAPVTDAYKVPETEVYNTVTTVGAVRDIEAKIYKTIDERIANIEIGTSGTGVKAIYFAGRKLDAHDDGTYHIDRLCALDALGFKIPDGQEDAEIELVTKEYVDELLTKIPGSDIDLSDYVKQEDIVDFATKEFVQTKIAEAELADRDFDLSAYYTKSETEAAIKSAVDVIEVPDVSGLATKKELQEAINSIEHPTVDLEGYATEQWVNKQGFLKEHQDLSEYAKKSELEALEDKIPSIEGLASETYVDAKFEAIVIPEVPKKVSELENDASFATETFVKNAIAEAELNDKEVDLTGYATKDDLAAVEEKIPSVSGLATEQFVLDKIAEVPTDYLKEIPSEYITEAELNAAIKNIKHPTIDLTDYATKEYVESTAVQQKYEVLPIEGMFVQYRDGEIRLNTQRVVPTKQQVGATGDPNMYYATFRAFAPKGATQCKEGLNGKIDAEYSALTTDAYGRKYTTIWAAIANTADGGTTWSKWGDQSNLDKYLGFYYHFEWYNNDTLIGKDKVRVILTNDTCHDDLVPDAVARRIDDKVSLINSNITNINNQIQNIEQNYVTNETLQANYVTNEYIQTQEFVTNEILESNYVTTNQLTEKVETTVTEVIQEKVETGEIAFKVDSISYGEF